MLFNGSTLPQVLKVGCHTIIQDNFTPLERLVVGREQRIDLSFFRHLRPSGDYLRKSAQSLVVGP